MLKKKYNIEAKEIKSNDAKLYFKPELFKIIIIVPTRAVEKRKMLGLYLID